MWVGALNLNAARNRVKSNRSSDSSHQGVVSTIIVDGARLPCKLQCELIVIMIVHWGISIVLVYVRKAGRRKKQPHLNTLGRQLNSDHGLHTIITNTSTHTRALNEGRQSPKAGKSMQVNTTTTNHPPHHQPSVLKAAGLPTASNTKRERVGVLENVNKTNATGCSMQNKIQSRKNENTWGFVTHARQQANVFHCNTATRTLTHRDRSHHQRVRIRAAVG